MKKRRLFAVLLSCMVFANPAAVIAAESYNTYTFTDYGMVVSVPDSLDLVYDATNSTFSASAEVMVTGDASTAGVTISTGTDITYVNESDSTLTANGVLSFGDSGAAVWTKDEIQNGSKKEPISVEISSFPMVEGTYSASISYNITAQKIVDTNKDSEYFCYSPTTYKGLDGTVYKGYSVTGFSTLGYEHFMKDVSSADTVTVHLPYSYKNEPIIMVSTFGFTAADYSFNSVLTNADMPYIELVFSKPVKYVRGFNLGGNSSNPSYKLTGITLNEGLEVIEIQSFFYCTGLTSLELPSTLRFIGNSAFKGCPLEGSLIIPEAVETIGEGAFYNNKLSSIVIPHYIEFLTAFKKETSVEGELYDSVIIKADSTEFNQPDTSGWWFNNTGSGSAFFANQIITFNDGDYKYVVGKNSAGSSRMVLTKIQDEVVITDASPNVTDGVLNANAYQGDKSLSSVVVENSVSGIGSLAFSESSITSIVLPENIEVGKRAFYKCNDLVSLTLPNGFKANGIEVFRDMTALKTVVCEANATFAGSDFYRCTALTSIDLGSGIVEIPSKMFYGCSSLKSITIPDTVEKIQSYAFYGCSLLSEIYMPRSVTWVASTNTTWSGLPSDCTVYYEGTTEEFNAITNVSKLTGSISNIVCLGDTATLEEPILDDEVSTPSDAEPMEYLAINGVSILTYEDLRNMTFLIELTIGQDILEIEENAFDDCDSLERIIYEGTEEDWTSIIGIEFVPSVDIIFYEISDEDITEVSTPSDAVPDEVPPSGDDIPIESEVPEEDTNSGVISGEVPPSDEVSGDDILIDENYGEIKFEEGEPLEEDDIIEVDIEEIIAIPKEEDISEEDPDTDSEQLNVEIE